MEGYIESLSFFKQPGYQLKTIEKLSGGQQNHNYKITVENGLKFVCRVPGIDAIEHGQKHQILYNNSMIAYEELKIAPRPCFFDESSGIMLTEYIDGDTLCISALRDSTTILDKIISAIRFYHKLSESSTAFVSSKASDVLFGYDLSLLEGWCEENEIEKTRKLQSLLKASITQFDSIVNCHNDLVPANFINSSDGQIYIIDWEWSGPGDRFGDLAPFVALSEQDAAGEELILQKYLDPQRPTDLDRARLYLWRIWFTLRGGLWALTKAKSVHFSNRMASEITEDDDYEKFASDWIKEFVAKLDEPITEKHMSNLQGKILEKSSI